MAREPPVLRTTYALTRLRASPSVCLAGPSHCGPRQAREQCKATNEQNEHHERIEQARRLKINVHVHNHAGEDEKRTPSREQPTEYASAAPEKHGDADLHGNECDAERT